MTDDSPSSGTPYVLEGRGLVSGFDKTPFLRDVDFAVEEGQVVCLLGANGAGKSTLIMTLAGQIKQVSGEVVLNGSLRSDPMETRVRDGHLAVITQERSVFMSLTVKQNIRLAGSTEHALVAIFPELHEHIDRPVAQLSGGQQQMLAVGRAICSDPRVILADEVSLGLAPMIVDRLLATLSDVARTKGIAVVIVEQFVDKALRFSDRAYVLSRGEVVLQAPCAELLQDITRVTEHYL